MGAALLLSGAASQAGAEEAAVEGGAASSAEAGVAAAAPQQWPADPSQWRNYVDFTFRFKYPPQLRIVDLMPAFDQPQSTLNPRRENPVKAELVAADGGEARLTVVSRQASALKLTLTQVTDITQLGGQAEVAGLLFPPGSRLLAASSQAFPLPPRDTGTVVGVMQRQPITLYQYEVSLPGGTRMAAAVGARLGQVFVAGGTAPEGAAWEAAGPALTAAVASFRLIPKA